MWKALALSAALLSGCATISDSESRSALIDMEFKQIAAEYEAGKIGLTDAARMRLRIAQRYAPNDYILQEALLEFLDHAKQADSKSISDQEYSDRAAATEIRYRRAIQQAQATAEAQQRASNAAAAAIFAGSMGRSMQRNFPAPTYQPPVRCTSSRDFSGVVSTSCY